MSWGLASQTSAVVTKAMLEHQTPMIWFLFMSSVCVCRVIKGADQEQMLVSATCEFDFIGFAM